MDPIIEQLGITDPTDLMYEKEKAPLGLYLEYKAKDAWATNPVPSLVRLSEEYEATDAPVPALYDETGMLYQDPSEFKRTKPRVTRAEWEKDPELYHPSLSFEKMASEDGTVTIEKAKLVKKWKEEDLTRKEIIARGPDGFVAGSLGLAAQFITSAVDPINLATAFIPIVPAGTLAVRLGRMGSLMARGLVEGAVGNALVEPLVLAGAHAGQMDYTYWDSGVNILFGAALGFGLHTGIGKISDALEIRSFRDHEARIKYAWANMEEGRSVDMENFIRASRLENEVMPKVRDLPDLKNIQDPVEKQAAIDAWHKQNAVDDGDLVPTAMWKDRVNDFASKLPFDSTDQTTVIKLFKGQAVDPKELSHLKKTLSPLFNDADPRNIRTDDVFDTIKTMGQDYLLSYRSQRMRDFDVAEEIRLLAMDTVDNNHANPGSNFLTPDGKTDLGKNRGETVKFIQKEVKELKDRISKSDLDRKKEVLKNIESAEYKVKLTREKREPLIKAIIDEFTDVNPGTIFTKKALADISPELKHRLAVELGGTEEAHSFMLWTLHEYNNMQSWLPKPGEKVPTGEVLPFILTPDDKNRLIKLGYSPEDINNMTPEQGISVVFRGWEKGKPEPAMPEVFTGATGTPAYLYTLYQKVNDSMDYASFVNLRAMAHSQAKIASMLDYIKKVKDWGKKAKPGDANYEADLIRQAIDSALWGTGTRIPGARASMDALQNALSAKYQGGLLGDLERAGLFKKMYDTSPEGLEFNKKVARELWEFDKADGKKGITNDVDALKVAEIIHTYQELAVDRLIKEGAVITRLPGYIVKQSHNREKISKVSYEDWKTDILPKLDQQATFRGDNPEEFLRSVYDNIVSGKYTVFDNESDVSIKDNLGARVSAHRRLFFNTADDWFNYNDKYGNSSFLLPTVQYGLERAAKNAAVMDFLGPTPKAVLNSVINYMKEDMSGNVKALKMLERRSNEWDSAIDEVLGLNSIPANPTIGKISSNLRAIQNMSKLGSAVLSAVTDVPFFAAEMRYQGDSLLHAYYTALTNVLKGRRGGQQKDIARMLGVGLDGIRGTVLTRFTGTDDVLTGKMAYMNNKFFQLSGLNWWTDAQKTGFGLMVSHYLASNADKEFDSLNKGLKRTLKLYDITTDDWNIMRSKGVFTGEDGVKYLLPDEMRRAGVGEELEEKLRMYIVDSADRAVPTPGLRERMILKGGILGGGATQAGTVWGEAVRLFSQFKSFPLTVTRKVLGREIFGQEGAERLGSIAQLLVGTTVLGYAAMSLKDITKGKTLRDPLGDKKYSIWATAFAQGGGLGIMSDFLFSLQSRYGQGALETFMGPSYATMSDFYNVYAAIKEGMNPEKEPKAEKAANAAVNALKNNMPYINLFYTRSLVDFAITKNLQESISPGYQSRVQNQLEKEYGQEYWIETPDYLKMTFKPEKILGNITK